MSLKVDQLRALAKRQKDRFEKEIQELQAELQELQDEHFQEVEFDPSHCSLLSFSIPILFHITIAAVYMA